MTYVWVKYRSMFSSSLGKWEYEMVGIEDALPRAPKKKVEEWIRKNFIESMHSEYSHSEHYRGVEFEIETPPDEIIKKMIMREKTKIESANERIAEMTRALATAAA